MLVPSSAKLAATEQSGWLHLGYTLFKDLLSLGKGAEPCICHCEAAAPTVVEGGCLSLERLLGAQLERQHQCRLEAAAGGGGGGWHFHLTLGFSAFVLFLGNLLGAWAQSR